MRVPIFQIDAFATQRFAGNPAAVMPLDRFPEDALLQAIAAENNLSETAFLVPEDRDWRLRWFTPAVEVPLCGHATLASAWVVLERLQPDREQVVFHTLGGVLTVRRAGPRFVMDFPAKTAEPVSTSQPLTSAIGKRVTALLANDNNYLAVLESATAVRSLSPDFAAIARLDRAGLIVTAAGDDGYDCVSRYFAPARGIPEDPVTGSAHCALSPYWSARTGKREIRAFQASHRGGELLCRMNGTRVELEGACTFYMEGHAEI